MDQFAKRASIGEKVKLTLTNGNILEGEITDFGFGYIVLKTGKGIAGIHHNMVGVWEIFFDSNIVQSEEERETKTVNESEITFLEPGPETAQDESEIAQRKSDSENTQSGEIESTHKEESEEVETEIEEYGFVETKIKELLEDFSIKLASAELTLKEPDLSFPLSSLDSENTLEDKKRWDKINSQYRNCIKNRNYSQLSTLASELLKFAEKYPDIGAFHYNAGCFLTHIENFEQALIHFEQAFTLEALPKYLYNAAYTAFKTQDYEKAHTNLAVYFNTIYPLEDTHAWYIFCRLTETEFQNSVFREVLLSFLNDTSIENEEDGYEGKEGKGNGQVNEDYIRKSTLFSLESALYILQKNGKYREAEPIITFLERVKTGKEKLCRKNILSELDLFFSEFLGCDLTEYQKRLEILENYEKNKQNKDTNKKDVYIKNPDVDETIINSTGIRDLLSGKVYESDIDLGELGNFSAQVSGSTDENGADNDPPEILYSKIPRKHGFIFKYVAPKGYGFIRDEEGTTYFFHLSSIIDNSISITELNNIYWGTETHVIFHPTINEQGNVAVQISGYKALEEMQKLAERYAQGGDYEKAIELSEYILSVNPDHPLSKSTLKIWQEKQNAILEKEQALNALIEAEPNNRENWDLKASFLLEHKRYEEALSILNKVLELTPEVINSLPSGRRMSSFSEIYNTNPDHVNVLYKKSLALHKLKRYKEALELANRTLELDPEHIDSLTLKASSLQRLDRVQEANELIDLNLEKAPESWELLFLKGKALLISHEYEEGLEYLEKVLKKSPEHPEILLIYGYALSKINKFDAAIKAYDKVVSLHPENNKALSNKGFILIMTGEYEKALGLYNDLIQLNPFNCKLWSKKGAILTKMNRSDEALRAVNRALEIAPDNAEALFTKGYIYSKIGRNEEALTYFNQVLELTPFDQKALAKRAFVQSKLGIHSKAFESIEEALDLNRYNARTWYYKGFIYYNMKEYDEALSAFNISAELNPADSRIKRMKQFTLTKLGRYEGEMAIQLDELQVEEELFDKELQEEYDSAFSN